MADNEVEMNDAALAGVTSDDDDSSSDSDFQEVEISEQDMMLVMNLEAQLEQNPNLYDTHIQVSW